MCQQIHDLRLVGSDWLGVAEAEEGIAGPRFVEYPEDT